MALIQQIQTSFSWGEISPKLLARVDLEQYDKATKTMVNAYPFLHGGCRRRPGTLFIGEVYNSARPVRLIPFIYSTTQSYLLVLNGGKFEFVKSDGTFITSGGSNYQLACPYSDDELPNLKFAQAGNTLFIAHPNHPPRQLQRASDTSWVLQTVPFTYKAVTDYWYENYAISFKILGGSTKFIVGDKFTFSVASGVVGTITKTGTGNGSLAQATATSSAPNENWTVECVYADSNRQKWSVTGSVSGTPIATWTTSKYPAAVAYFNQRLYFAGSTTEPQAIWGSSLDDYSDFTRGSNDNDGLKFTIASSNYDAIIHLTSARQLLPLTYSGEYSMTGSMNASITPSSVKIQPQTFHGTMNIRPIRIGTEVVFVQKDGLKLRAISYSVAEDANVAPDITLFAEHITESGIVDMDFAQDPDFIAWCVRADGELLSLTLAREYQTTGWARHTTDGTFENVTTLPSGGSSSVYLVANRTINGSQKRYIELLDYTQGIQSDCGVVYTGAPGVKGTVFSGLSHLEGKTVDVVADGFVHPPVTVTGGEITLQYAVNSIKVGLHYNTLIELLHPEFGDGHKQSSQGRAFSVHEMLLRFEGTINCKVNGYEVPFRKNTDGLDSVIPPFTGDKKVSAYGWRKPNNIKIEQVTPQPFTLLGVVIKGTVNE